MKPEDILANIPIGQRFDIDKDHYDYAVQNIELGKLTLSTNGDEVKEIHFRDAPENFKKQLTHVASEKYSLKLIEKTLGRILSKDEKAHYLRVWRLLHSVDNAFFKFCITLIGDYHALDSELAQTLLLGITRSRFSSTSALAHFDATGASGAGKDDLVSRVMTLIPLRYLDLFSSISPTALYYETIERKEDSKGRTYKITNPDRFNGKVICITEVADSAGFSALKALAEIDETKESTHAATVNGENVKMTIRGPRCVIITSVDGINDAQVKRRFIHASISDDTADNVSKKLSVAQRIMIDNMDMRDDPRTATACAGIDLIFSTQGIVFEPIDSKTEQLLIALNNAFINAGYGLTNVKQFYALCQCLALWSRFRRGKVRIEVSDVCGAWFLLSRFEKETVSKTTLPAIKVLKTIKELNDEADLEERDQVEGGNKYFKTERPTRAEIERRSQVPHATIYRLLRPTENQSGKYGELLELGYVLVQYRDGRTTIELSDLGLKVLGDAPKSVTVEGHEYKPEEPRAVGHPDVLEVAQLDLILERYYKPNSETETS